MPPSRYIAPASPTLLYLGALAAVYPDSFGFGFKLYHQAANTTQCLGATLMKAKFFRPFEPPFVISSATKPRSASSLVRVLIYLFLPSGKKKKAAGASFMWSMKTTRRCRQLVRYLTACAPEVDAVVASPALAVAAVERMQNTGLCADPSRALSKGYAALGAGAGLFANGAWFAQQRRAGWYS